MKSCYGVRLAVVDGQQQVIEDAVVADEADAPVVSDEAGAAPVAAAVSRGWYRPGQQVGAVAAVIDRPELRSMRASLDGSA